MKDPIINFIVILICVFIAFGAIVFAVILSVDKPKETPKVELMKEEVMKIEVKGGICVYDKKSDSFKIIDYESPILITLQELNIIDKNDYIIRDKSLNNN